MALTSSSGHRSIEIADRQRGKRAGIAVLKPFGFDRNTGVSLAVEHNVAADGSVSSGMKAVNITAAMQR